MSVEARSAKEARRDAVLEKVASPLRREAEARPRLKKANGAAQLSEEEIGFVIEGLAFSQRPIRAAGKLVTERYGLGPRGAFILALIAGGIVYPMDLAAVLRTGRSLITAELARLTDAKLIKATPDADDRRMLQLALTPLGLAAREQVREAMGRIVTENLAAYSADEIRLFARMLRDARLVDGAEQAE